MKPDVSAREEPYFEPRQRASRRRRAVHALVFAFIWAFALALTAYVALDTDAIQLGLLIAATSFLLAGILLGVSVLLRENHPGPLLPRIPRRPHPAGRP